MFYGWKKVNKEENIYGWKKVNKDEEIFVFIYGILKIILNFVYIKYLFFCKLKGYYGVIIFIFFGWLWIGIILNVRVYGGNFVNVWVWCSLCI